MDSNINLVSECHSGNRLLFQQGEYKKSEMKDKAIKLRWYFSKDINSNSFGRT